MRATNDVIASSRDQVNQRAPSTTQQPVTSTRGLDRNYTRALAVASQSPFPVPFCCLAARPHAAVNPPVGHFEPASIGVPERLQSDQTTLILPRLQDATRPCQRAEFARIALPNVIPIHDLCIFRVQGDGRCSSFSVPLTPRPL